jgi:hypothetical protein
VFRRRNWGREIINTRTHCKPLQKPRLDRHSFTKR